MAATDAQRAIQEKIEAAEARLSRIISSAQRSRAEDEEIVDWSEPLVQQSVSKAERDLKSAVKPDETKRHARELIDAKRYEQQQISQEERRILHEQEREARDQMIAQDMESKKRLDIRKELLQREHQHELELEKKALIQSERRKLQEKEDKLREEEQRRLERLRREHASQEQEQRERDVRAMQEGVIPPKVPKKGRQKKDPASRNVILIVTVDIGDGRVECVDVRAGDLTEDLAQEFVTKHGLEDHMVGLLTQFIEDQVKQLDPAVLEAHDGLREERRRQLQQKRVRQQNGTTAAEGGASSGAVAVPPSFPDSPLQESPVGSKRSVSAGRTRQPSPPPSTPYTNLLQKRPLSAGRSRPATASTLTTASSHSNSRGGTPGKGRPASARGARLRAEAVASEPLVGSEENKHRPLINPVSKQLMSKRNGPVYERLHKQAESRMSRMEEAKRRKEEEEVAALARERAKINEISRELTAKRSQGYNSFGDRLYEEGLRRKEQAEKHAQDLRAERETPDPEATFKPKISKLARKLKRSGPTWSRIVDSMGDQAREHKMSLQEEIQRKKEAECTFRPETNKKSKELLRNKRRVAEEQNLSHYEQLYLDAQRRQMKLEELAAIAPPDATFRPEIGTLPSRFEGEDEIEFFQRLTSSRREHEMALEMARNSDEHNIDPVTGQRLFHPKIGRQPSSQRNNSSLPIGDFLFASRHEKQDVLQRLSKRQEEHIVRSANRRKTTKTSETIVETLKQRRFQEIFNALDESGTGVLDLTEVSLDVLNPSIASTLKPIFDQLRTTQRTMNFGEFHRALDRSWSSIKSGPRSHLLRSSVIRDPSMEDPLSNSLKLSHSAVGSSGSLRGSKGEEDFRPHLNSRSEQLARQARPRDSDLYESLAHERQQWEEHRMQQREALARKELEGCTFKPKTTKYQPGRRTPSAERQRPSSSRQ